MMRVIRDCRSALFEPPRNALENEILFARIRSYSVRVQYISWNIAATILFYIFSDSLLNKYIADDELYINIVFHSIQALSIFAYFLTSFTNPGYIYSTDAYTIRPRSNININIIDTDNESNNLIPENQSSIIHTNQSHSPTYYDIYRDRILRHIGSSMINIHSEYNQNIFIDADNAPSNFCWRCKFLRPIRSKHCYDCDHCVAKFDHHCPMVGNCIGAGNHRYFVLFMVSQSIVVVWSFYISLNTIFIISEIFQKFSSWLADGIPTEHHTFSDWIFRLLIFFAVFFAMLIVVGLSGFHLYLAATNQTTYELLKPQIIENYIADEKKRKKKYEKNIRKQRLKLELLAKKKQKKLLVQQKRKATLKQKLKLLKKEKLLQKRLEKQQKRELEFIKNEEEKQRKLQELMRSEGNFDEEKVHESVMDVSVQTDDDAEEKQFNIDMALIDVELYSDDDEDVKDNALDVVIESDSVSISSYASVVDDNNDVSSLARARRDLTPGISHKSNESEDGEQKENITENDDVVNYFDEGIIQNIKSFLTASVRDEWLIPLHCTLHQSDR